MARHFQSTNFDFKISSVRFFLLSFYFFLFRNSLNTGKEFNTTKHSSGYLIYKTEKEEKTCIITPMDSKIDSLFKTNIF